ncbi:MAG: hypothetical protein IJR88_01855 [Clostridia bacterium]|nr:hypothetical protein [Clostridia bacterium]
MKEKFKNAFKKAIQFLLNPRLLLCCGIAWFITNGWSYVMFGIGTYFQIGWMIAVGGAYLTFLWLPISPEKIVTVAIAIGLLKLLFPKDEKTLAVLKEMSQKVKNTVKRKKKQKGRGQVAE